MLMHFKVFLNNSKRKPNKVCVDEGSEYYNKKNKKWLKDNNTEMYSTYNEGKFVVSERITRTLKNKNLPTYDSCIKQCLFFICLQILLINTIIHIITLLK